MKKYWKIIVPVAIGFASMSVHFLSIKDTAFDDELIFDMRKILGKTLKDDEIPDYAKLFGPFINKSQPEGRYKPMSNDMDVLDATAVIKVIPKEMNGMLCFSSLGCLFWLGR